ALDFSVVPRSCYANESVVRETCLRDHHLVGEHYRLVEPSVSIRVFQTHDAVGWVRKLLVRLLVRAGVIRDVEPALVIETGADRPLHQRWAGDELDLKTIGNSERLRGEFELRREGNGSNQADCDGGAQGKRVHALLIPSKRQKRQQENWIEACPGRRQPVFGTVNVRISCRQACTMVPFYGTHPLSGRGHSANMRLCGTDPF